MRVRVLAALSGTLLAAIGATSSSPADMHAAPVSTGSSVFGPAFLAPALWSGHGMNVHLNGDQVLVTAWEVACQSITALADPNAPLFEVNDAGQLVAATPTGTAVFDVRPDGMFDLTALGWDDPAEPAPSGRSCHTAPARDLDGTSAGTVTDPWAPFDTTEPAQLAVSRFNPAVLLWARG